MTDSKAKKVLLAIAIAIILALFIGYGIYTFYKPPKRENFCKEIGIKLYTNKESCEEVGGQWQEAPKPVVELNPDEYLCTRSSITGSEQFMFSCQTRESQLREAGYCYAEYACDKEYRDVREKYNRDVFIITLILGLVFIITGGILLKLESVSAGIMAGGIFTVIYGTLRYWGDMQDVLRWVILGIVLLILIWIGYKKFKK